MNACNKTETDSQTHKPVGRGRGGRVWDYGIQTTMYKVDK